MQPAEQKSDYCKNCTFQISAYLERMAFTEAPNANIPFLKKLHSAHIKTIPFETLDIFLNKRFTLTLSALYDKIVTRRRGGYCYELNGLFFYLLQQLGFEVSIHSAHLYDSNGVEIAKGLAPLHPENVALIASKLMIQCLKELLTAGKSFAFETTGSGTNYVKHLKSAKSAGYTIHLTFLWLSSPQQAVKRVAERVKQGGHYVPETIIIRRYHSGIKNLMNLYLPFVDSAIIMDASLEETEIIARKDVNKPINIFNSVIWKKLEKIAHEG